MRAVVVAGGKSQRMGREKALMPYKGKSLIEYSIEVLSEIEEKPLVISNNQDVSDFLKDFEVIPDLLPGRGPMGGIHTALKHTEDDILITACDTPLIELKTIASLVKQRRNAVIAVFMKEGKIYPFPGIYSFSLLDEIEKRLEGAGHELSLQDLIRNTKGVKYVEIDNVETITGINTPDDYRRITGFDVDSL